jgi:hypothetical protein
MHNAPCRLLWLFLRQGSEEACDRFALWGEWGFFGRFGGLADSLVVDDCCFRFDGGGETCRSLELGRLLGRGRPVMFEGVV